MAILMITSGQRAGTSFPLKAAQLVCGREANRDIQLLDPQVSRRHFVIKRDGETYSIEEDKQAKNGTFLNGKRLEGTTQLKDGDKIVAGATELLFVDSDDEFRINSLRAERVFSRATTSPTVSVKPSEGLQADQR